MKCKVRLTHTVELRVEGASEDAIQDWLNSTTPAEAANLVSVLSLCQDYDDEIILRLPDDAEVDYVIGDK